MHIDNFIEVGPQRVVSFFSRLAGSLVFPAALRPDDLRIGTAEGVRDWFRRIVKHRFAGRLENCVLDADAKIAFFGRARFADGYAWSLSLSAVVTPDDNLYSFRSLKQEVRCCYYRLDFNPDKPGPLFHEPLPHLHVCPAGNPRIPVSFASQHVIADFLEFLYLNHAYNTWRAYARRVWAHGADGEDGDVSDLFDRFAQALGGQQPLCLPDELVRGLNQLRSRLRDRAADWPTPLHPAALAMNYWVPPGAVPDANPPASTPQGRSAPRSGRQRRESAR